MMQLVVSDVVIEEIDYKSLSDADIEALNVFHNALGAEAYPEDPPQPLEITRAEVQNIPTFIGFKEFWGRDAHGALAARGEAWWRNTEDNRHVAWIDVRVRPDMRRRGIAIALLRLVTDVAAAEGREVLTFSTSERVPSGAIFAELIGGEAKSAVHTNRLALAELDRDLVRGWTSEGPGRAPGYSLVAVDGWFPDDIVDAVADLYGVMNTAPRDDLDMDDQQFTAEQLREWEKTMAAERTERWSLFACHDASGELVGLSEVFWNWSEPKTVFQGNTGVRPEHRGHALGKWLKAVNLERIMRERPDVEDVRTGNADSNDAMLGINNALGFKPYIAHTQWQATLQRVRDYLAGSND